MEEALPARQSSESVCTDAPKPVYFHLCAGNIHWRPVMNAWILLYMRCAHSDTLRIFITIWDCGGRCDCDYECDCVFVCVWMSMAPPIWIVARAHKSRQVPSNIIYISFSSKKVLRWQIYCVSLSWRFLEPSELLASDVMDFASFFFFFTFRQSKQRNILEGFSMAFLAKFET